MRTCLPIYRRGDRTHCPAGTVALPTGSAVACVLAVGGANGATMQVSAGPCSKTPTAFSAPRYRAATLTSATIGRWSDPSNGPVAYRVQVSPGVR